MNWCSVGRGIWIVGLILCLVVVFVVCGWMIFWGIILLLFDFWF